MDMNNIVYAGRDGARAEELTATKKYWQFIRCAARGELKTAKHRENYARGDILIIPPLCDFERSAAGIGESYIFMDGTALPFRQPAAVPDEQGGGIAHAFAQAERYYAMQSLKAAAVLGCLGDLIINYIVMQTERSAYSPPVKLVRADIDANVSNPAYALDGFLRALPLNGDYVRKLFKKETGVTPHDYLLGERMKLAARLIVSGMSNQYSRYSVGQIAEMCGFADPLYFSRVFKKYYGCAPSEYGR